MSFLGTVVTVHRSATEKLHDTNGSHVSVSTSSAKARTIKVKGLTKQIDKEQLELYFENTSRSGGGEIETVQLESDGCAMITFIDAKGEFLFM